jgi:hypothetical protein
MGSVESSHSWGHSWVHRCFFRMSEVNYLLNRLFHLKNFQTFYYSRGQGEGIFRLFRGKGVRPGLFMYLFIWKSSKTNLSFWISGSLTACLNPPKNLALAKMLLAYAVPGKGFRVWSYFLESSVMWVVIKITQYADLGPTSGCGRFRLNLWVYHCIGVEGHHSTEPWVSLLSD